ncbi:hypothetical protein NIES267_41900 [Calothrix parasitica NIES-267]|uniref:Uncharacterized protein n=1 Tax=Calothrix parasitica NIES-267 TaxID=1973488 RepID=A0A1Z4LU32_9CYAN|nr:hypothetical protein NIES267_41900 [Calothrix parasitica NIES-267]
MTENQGQEQKQFPFGRKWLSNLLSNIENFNKTQTPSNKELIPPTPATPTPTHILLLRKHVKNFLKGVYKIMYEIITGKTTKNK